MTNKPDLVVIASTIKRMIDEQIYSDQGTKYRAGLKKWLPLMNDAYRPSDEKPIRHHLGASLIGSPCDRALFYNYRWVIPSYFDSRLIKLFNTGHRAEAEFISMLECIGVEVLQQTGDGKQYNFSHSNSHVGGSLDGILKNTPFLENFIVTAEFKTSSDKLFKELVAGGVKKEKHQHYIQMVIGMEKLNAQYCCYMCKNKDTDDLYVEIIEHDSHIAKHYLERAEHIVYSDKLPTKIANSDTAFNCRYCDFSGLCHWGDVSEVDVNCRSCKHSYPSKDGSLSGKWQCVKYNNAVLPRDKSIYGCKTYEQRILS